MKGTEIKIPRLTIVGAEELEKDEETEKLDDAKAMKVMEKALARKRAEKHG